MRGFNKKLAEFSPQITQRDYFKETWEFWKFPFRWTITPYEETLATTVQVYLFNIESIYAYQKS